MLPFLLLVVIGGLLLVTNVWAVIDTRIATGIASREVARWLVEQDGSLDAAALSRGATEIAVEAMHGRQLLGPPTVELDGLELRRCQPVEVVVRAAVPAIRIPFVGGFSRRTTVASHRSQIVDPTRSGLPGEATCLR